MNIFDSIQRDFTYDLNTGNLMKVGWSYRRAQSIIKPLNPYQVQYQGIRYTATAIIWVIVHGRFPLSGCVIDHINGNREDNRLVNLREVSQSLNVANSRVRDSNTSGIKGVSWRKDTNKWHARINKDGKAYSLGSFESIEEAALAYHKASLSLFGTSARPVGVFKPV